MLVLASCAVLVAACSSSSSPIAHPKGATQPVIVVSRDDIVSGGLQALGGPEIVVFGDGSTVVRRFTSDNLPRRAQFDEPTMQRLLQAARSAGLFRVASTDEMGTATSGVASAATRVTITTDAGAFAHATVETNGSTPGQARLMAFLTTLRDAVESTTGAPFIATAWLVVDGGHCRLVPGGTRPANVNFSRALFPNENGQPLATLSQACA
jgi:hypothetical protein